MFKCTCDMFSPRVSCVIHCMKTPDNILYIHPYTCHMWFYMGVNVRFLSGCVIFSAPRKVDGCVYASHMTLIWVFYPPQMQNLYVFHMGTIHEYFFTKFLQQ